MIRSWLPANITQTIHPAGQEHPSARLLNNNLVTLLLQFSTSRSTLLRSGSRRSKENSGNWNEAVHNTWISFDFIRNPINCTFQYTWEKMKFWTGASRTLVSGCQYSNSRIVCGTKIPSETSPVTWKANIEIFVHRFLD